jgi:hypothetical protein
MRIRRAHEARIIARAGAVRTPCGEPGGGFAPDFAFSEAEERPGRAVCVIGEADARARAGGYSVGLSAGASTTSCWLRCRVRAAFLPMDER